MFNSIAAIPLVSETIPSILKLSFNVFPVCEYVDGCGLVDAERERETERELGVPDKDTM